MTPARDCEATETMENHLQASMALLALSHSPIEQALYESLLALRGRGDSSHLGAVSLRSLLDLTGLGSYSTLRRARAGLVGKMSIDCKRAAGAGAGEEPSSHYFDYRPEEVFERRRRAGLDPYPREYSSHASQSGFSVALKRVVNGYGLSRREAQVALCCAEGLSNAEIGAKLSITAHTVKFHLRQIFVKFGVRRRGELISRLLRHEDGDAVRFADREGGAEARG